MTDDPARPATRMTASEIRTLCLASLGGALEFYDFVVFVFFTAVIGRLFFPADLPDWLRQTQTFGLFAAGYLARPLGGVVMAHFGDVSGRKRIFTLSVLLMALPTLAIGLLPTYRSIGPLAPLLLLAMRVMQGAAIGGEAPGGWVFVAEHARPARRGLAIGLLTAGLTGGILLGALVATGLNLALPPDRILAGWWRLPFLVGGVFGLGAMALRRWLDETPVFLAIRARAATARALPLRLVLSGHRRAVLLSMASTWTLTAAIVVVILMTPTLLQRQFGVAPRDALVANLLATVTLTLSAVCVGLATDRFGLRRTALVMLTLLAVSACALYRGVAAHPGWLLPLYALAGAGAGAVTLTPVLMVRSFPARLRFSGLSLSYNLAYALFGGTTPLLVAWLAHRDRLFPSVYVALVAAIGLVACLLAPRPDAAGMAEPGP
jgi:MFS family permease